MLGDAMFSFIDQGQNFQRIVKMIVHRYCAELKTTLGYLEILLSVL